MPDTFPQFLRLISDSELENDEQRWEKIVQVFRPGIRSWLRRYSIESALRLDQEPDSMVEELFIQVKPIFIRDLTGSTAEFTARLTRAMGEHLRSLSGNDYSAETDTQSLKLSGAETASFDAAPDGVSSERLLALLAELTDATREVAAIRCIEGLKYREIAKRIGIEVAEVVRLDREAQMQLLGLVQTDGGLSGGNCERNAAVAATIDRDIQRE